MEFDGEVVRFNIFETMKYPSDTYIVFAVSMIDPMVQKIFEINGRNELEVYLTKYLELGTT